MQEKRQRTFWREDESHTFVNPYNFVRLGGGVKRGINVEGDLTGEIKCRIIAKTPLAFPDAAGMREIPVKNFRGSTEMHPVLPFFSVNGAPIITGSEIRGVIRSAYETLSNGCLSVNNNDILSARHSTPRRAGILIRQGGEWRLFAAKSRRLKAGEEPRPHETAVREWATSKIEQRRGAPLTMRFAFTKTEKEIKAENLELAVENYNACLDIYCENNRKVYKPLVKKADGKKDGGIYPVYYETVTDKDDRLYVYLSPAQISRTVFNNRLSDLLGSYSKCTDSQNLCEACSLFGMMGTSGRRASHLRFMDAHLKTEGDVFIKDQTLKELAPPKITSLEFYTSRPNGAKYWTYDYMVKGYYRDGGVTVPDREVLTGENLIKVRGRKYYFHSEGGYNADVRTKRNITTDLIKPETEFEFSVFFEKINRETLDRIVWALCIGENRADSLQMHKIGHGKPIGLGSAKILVDGITLRSVDVAKGQYTVSTLAVEDCIKDNTFQTEEMYYKDFMSITNFEFTRGLNVSYPIADSMLDSKNSKASHMWFWGNRTIGWGGTGLRVSIKHVLPKLTSPSLSLPRLVKDSPYPTNRPQKIGDNNAQTD